MQTTSAHRKLRTSDPNLLLTISQAVNEFDQASRGEHPAFLAATRLGELLQASFDTPAGSSAETFCLDVNTIGIVGRALPRRVKTVSEVASEARKIASEMVQASGTRSVTPDVLRTFCIELGNNLLAYRESGDDYDTTNPYQI